MFRNVLHLILVVSFLSVLAGCAGHTPAEDEGVEGIRVIHPESRSPVSSPLEVTGKARGPWYFEGDFGMRLLDCDGNLIAKGHLSARGRWMTESFLPFEGTLTFDRPSSCGKGRLLLESANPSGRPELQRTKTVLVTFAD